MIARPKLVAIVNITPDSFSDGGALGTIDAALNYIRQQIEAGADMIDIGAESTRPNAIALTPEQEWQRLAPILRQAVAICVDNQIGISLDTRHAETARRALDAGVNCINDVNGFRDEAMRDVVKDSDCQLVMMHSIGIPVDASRTIPEHADAVEVVMRFFESQCELLESTGIARHRIILDAGIGFGKTPAQSLQLMLRMADFHALGLPLYVGHSRKSFMSLFTTLPPEQRDDVTLAFSAMLVHAGANYLRVHDVARHHALLERLCP